MSTTTPSDSQSASTDQLLSHYFSRLLRSHGGALSTVQAAERASENLGIQNTGSHIEDNAGSVYQLTEDETGCRQITSVSPIGTEPPQIARLFSDTTEVTSLADVTTRIGEGLVELGYETCQALTDADPNTLATELNTELIIQECGDRDPRNIIPDGVVTESEIDSLTDAGYSTATDLALADVDELAEAAPTLTQTKAETLQQSLLKPVNTVSVSDIQDIIDAAQLRAPNSPRLFGDAIQRYSSRTQNGTGKARVTPVSTETETVGDPIALTQRSVPVEELKQNPASMPAEVQYVSAIGDNADSPVPTGLPVLEETDYQKIPKADTHPDAGDDALPTDKQGNVIPPAVPTEPHRQLPVDELVAKKLRRGLVPVCLVGPPGSGKNYLFKYLAWATNRGYRSIDASSSTMAEDLFGPLTPNESGTITPRNGAVKQGLLNGDIVVINEFPVMQAGAATELHRLLNEGKLLVKSHGELIEPHPAARLVITMNPPNRENRATEPMSRPTRGRFRRFEMPYPQSVEDEARALNQQVNTPETVVPESTLKKIVEFAHKTREDKHDNWPTLSTRNLTILCEDIEDGVAPKAAVKGTLWGVAEPYQQPGDAEQTINTMF